MNREANRKYPVVPVRLPDPEALEELRITASSTGQTVSQFVRQAISTAVKEAKKEVTRG
jgi:predicted DNA-binding protein